MDKMNCFGDEKEKVDDDSRDNTMFRNMKIPDTLELQSHSILQKLMPLVLCFRT